MTYSTERIDSLISQLVEKGSNRNGSPRVTSTSLIAVLGDLRAQVVYENHQFYKKINRLERELAVAKRED